MHQLEYDLNIIFNFISGVLHFKKNTAWKYVFQFFKGAIIDYHITFNFQPPAPEALLTVIRCKCQNSTRKQCCTNLCSCKRNGLSCVTACVENETEMDERNLFDTLFT